MNYSLILHLSGIHQDTIIQVYLVVLKVTFIPISAHPVVLYQVVLALHQVNLALVSLLHQAALILVSLLPVAQVAQALRLYKVTGRVTHIARDQVLALYLVLSLAPVLYLAVALSQVQVLNLAAAQYQVSAPPRVAPCLAVVLALNQAAAHCPVVQTQAALSLVVATALSLAVAKAPRLVAVEALLQAPALSLAA